MLRSYYLPNARNGQASAPSLWQRNIGQMAEIRWIGARLLRRCRVVVTRTFLNPSRMPVPSLSDRHPLRSVRMHISRVSTFVLAAWLSAAAAQAAEPVLIAVGS